jgi:concanavalin A-like lectin/glucanase superfamily protein
MRFHIGTATRVRQSGLCLLVIAAGALVGTASAAAATKVAVWHMEETSGPMQDAGTAPANNGTLRGSITRGVAGVSGRGYSFTRGWVTVPTAGSLNPGSANVTIQASVKPTSLPTSGDFDIIRKGDSPSQLYKVEILQSGALFCQFRGSNGIAAVTSVKTIKPNSGFHTIKCIKTNTNLRAIVDGTSIGKTANIGSITNQAPVVIGAHTGGNNDFYKGVMDEVSITIG